MSINFPTDNSTQNIGRTYTAGSVYSGFTTSNYITSFITPYDLISDRQASILNLSNALQANIDKKQNILVSTCNLAGIGSAITQLDYNNITFNKPDISSFGINYWSLSNNNIFNLTCNLGIGTTNTLGSRLSIIASTIGDGGNNSGSNSCLYIKQTSGWSGNQPWALYVDGYSYLGGFRINAADAPRSLYSTSTVGLGFATFNAVPITFIQNTSSERMRIDSTGNLCIGTTISEGYRLNIAGNSVISGSLYQNNSTLSNIFLGKIGIGTTNIGTYSLNIAGSLNATSFSSNTIPIDFNSYATITSLTSTSNTLTAVINSSNSITSNFTSNYTNATSNILLGKINTNETLSSNFTSNYTNATSNILLGKINTNETLSSNFTSNYTNATSNILLGKINTNETLSSNFTSNYTNAISNILLGKINTNETLSSNFTSNYTNATSNILQGTINSSNTTASNFTSNYTNVISNILQTNINQISAIASTNMYNDASQYNNFKLENNQSNLIYPPIGISTSAVSSFTPALVQSQFGNYQISASSNITSAYLAFDKSLTTEYTNPQLPYRADGTYSNASPYLTSNIVSGTVVVGEWLQLYYDKGFAANSITISGIAVSNLKCPKDFILAGSKDSSNWILLSSQVGIGTSAYAPSNIYSIYNYTSYNYYRLIVPKTIGAQTLSIADISLGGNPNTSFTPLDNYNILLYNTNEKQFPPRIYDSIDNTTEYLSSNEILNVTPASYFRQVLTLNNHGNYTLYSSSKNTPNSNAKHLLFNYDLSTNSGTEEAVWGNNNYTQPTGIASATNFNRIGLTPYYGDWIIVKFPFPIVLTRFRFYSRNTLISRSPGLWKCYGSNDGVNWTEISDASNTITSIPETSYTANINFYQHVLPSYFDIPYLYIGWVINKLVGGNAAADIMNFIEIQIYGKDDISNSYLNVWNKTNTSIFNTLGNVGIGTTNPTQRLTVIGNSYLSGNVGIGTTNPGSYLLNVAGSLNVTSFLSNTLPIDFNSYATTTALAGKENTLTFSSPLTRTTNTISIDLSAYSTTSTNNTNYLRLAAATNDLSGKLSFLNSIGLNTPQLGDYGGTGDRLILWKGGGGYPYSLGMNSGTMWYSVPNGAIHNFYVNGISECQINSAGLTVFGNVSTETFAVVDSTSYTNQFQLLISAPTSTTPARIQTIRQNIGFSQNLILQGENLSGNVGIGITNPAQKLSVVGNSYFNGNVGIGTATPSQQLHLNAGALYITGSATITGDTASASFWNQSGVGPTIAGANIAFQTNGSTERMRINSSGNVGIGTSNPLSTLHINAGAILKVLSFYDLGNNFQYTGFGATSGLIHNIPSTVDAFQFRVGTSTTTANEVMRITGTGNVGIGTTNPLSMLHINAGSILKILSFYDLGNNFQYTGFGATSGLIHNIPSTGDAFQFRVGTSTTAANEVMRITGTGNVGIGTTNPGTRLHIEHASTSSGGLQGGLYVFNPNNAANNCSVIGARIAGNLANRAGISLDVSGHYGWNIGINGSDTTNRLLRFTNTFDASGNDIMVLGSNGNVGIGVNNPQQILDINGSLVIRAAESNAGGTKGIFFRDQYTGVGNYYNCSILTYNHAAAVAEVFSDGLSINGWDGVSICTGANTRQERMRVDKDGNVYIGTTTNPNSYRLNVAGSLNATSFLSNTLPIDFNSYASTTALTTASNTLQANINNNDTISSNFTRNNSNILLGTINTTSNTLQANINTNNAIASNYTYNNLISSDTSIHNQYPSKLYDTSSTQSNITYLNQTPVYYENITITNEGTYDIYASSIDDTNIQITGTNNTISDVNNNSEYSYISFVNNGSVIFNSNIVCDILVVGGGGSGGPILGGGGGGGAVVYVTNAIISAGTYNVVVGAGGARASYNNPGNKGGNSSFAGIIAEGGGGGGLYNNSNNNNNALSGGSGGGAGADILSQTITDGINSIGALVGTQSSLNGYSGTIYQNRGGDAIDRINGLIGGGGGGGGAGEIGQTGNLNYNSVGGKGGDGILINITGTNLYWGAGGGGGQYSSVDNSGTFRAGSGGLGGGGGGGWGNGQPDITGYIGYGGTGGLNTGANGYNFIGGVGASNTGSGGGGGAYLLDTIMENGQQVTASGAGGSGIVIIRYLKSTITTKKELVINNTDNSGCSFKSFQYTNNGYYVFNNRYILSGYFGDWFVLKMPNSIYLTKYRIYNRTSFAGRAPALFKIYGSTDGTSYEEIVEASNNDLNNILTPLNYLIGYYEKIVNYYQKKYLYFGIVVNKIVGGDNYSHLLNITKFHIFGNETNANNIIVPRYLSYNGTTQTFTGILTNTGIIINSNLINGPGNITLTGSSSTISGSNLIVPSSLIYKGTELSSLLQNTITTILNTSNTLQETINANNFISSNFTRINSNILSGTINTTSNILRGVINSSNSTASNYTNIISNILQTNINQISAGGSSSIYNDASQYNNFKLENNQSNLIYPPVGISTSAVSSFTSALVQSQFGNYQVSASSNTASAYLAFDRNLTTEFTISSAYSNTSGNYSNSGIYRTSNIVSGAVVVGEWLQLYYDKGFAANSITISGVAANNASCPKDFILAGSKDSSNWILLSSQVGITTTAYTPSNIYSIYNFTSYNYYRLIVTKTISSTNLNIADVSLGGNPNTSFTPLDNFNILLYNTNEKQFPPRIWDVAPTAEALSSNEIFNITPASYYKQQFSLNNHGTYTLFTSSFFSSGGSKSFLFDNNTGTSDAHWQAGNYTSATGIASSANTNTIGLNSTYRGDWIIVKFPFPILLTRFRFYNRSVYEYRAPGFWRCYGSNDGVNWTEITDASNTLTLASVARYVNSFYEHIMPLYFDIPYLYIGWVVNQLAGTETIYSYANIMNFAEMQIFGKDDISNSYLNVWNKSNTSIFNTLGNVGIGTTNPIQRLSVIGNTYFNGNVGIGTTNPTSTLSVIGNANISGTLTLSNMLIENFLFNNTGISHEASIRNFNDVTSFGYRHILDPTVNSPDTSTTSQKYYSWYIGLGSNFGADSYGAQFAIPRNLTNPTMSIRFKEATNWSSWSAITAGFLKGNANFNVDTWQNSTDTKQRIFFANNGTTFIKGHGTSPLIFRNSTDSNVITVLNNGNVGIGTTPSTSDGNMLRLHTTFAGANDQLLITGTSTIGVTNIRLSNGGTGVADAFIGLAGTAYGLAGDVYRNNLYLQSPSSIVFNTQGSGSSSANMIILGNGNVGIGTTTPFCKLSFGASTGFKILSLYETANNNFQFVGFGANSGLCFNNVGSGDSFQFRVGASASSANEIVRITGSGRIGVGTANPSGMLELYSTSQTVPEIILSGTDFSTNTTSTSGVAFLLGSNLTNDRQFWIADSSAIGVGTTNPVIRIMPNTRTIDAVATNGTTPLSLGIGNTGSSLFLNGNNIYGDASQLNNFKFENNNQSNLIYPPPIGTSTSLTRYFSPSASNMQAGTYIMSASSNLATAYFAFDKNLATEFSIASAYSNTSGNYSNASPYITNTFVSGTDIRGEWLQLYYDKGFVANSIRISGVAANSAKCPKDFVFAASKEGSNWILLSSQVGIGTTAYSPSNIYSIYNFTSYNFYRLIVTKTISSTDLSIADISLSGNPNTSFTPLDNYNIQVYNTNEKQFPPRPWDGTVTAEALTSNEIFNVTPTSYYKQQFSLNNHGNYIIYSSSTYGSAYTRSSLFNYDFTDSSGNIMASWVNSNYAAGQAVAGNLNAVGLNNNYYGDWIVVRFPYPILLTRFRFYGRPGLLNRSPGFWRCYGSNDGVNWTEITDASNTPAISTIATYTITDTNGTYYEKTVLNLDIPYLYIGWVVNRLSGSSSGETVMNFAEMQIFGKDDISNSYLNVWNKTNTSIFNTLGNVGIGTTNPTQRLTVVGNSYFNGNVGIGTTTPGELLNLYGTADCFAKIDASGGTGQAGLRLFAGNGASSHRASRIDFFNNITSTSAPRWTLISDTIQNGTNDFRVVNGAGASIFTILQSGNIGIGTTTPASPLVVNGNIDCRGGISIDGSPAFYDAFTSVETVNKDWTYLTFKPAGTGDDWCYVRQIGGTNSIKLAFDFHDDNEAKFVIRKIFSTQTPTDGITEVFTVNDDNIGIGNSTPSAPLWIGNPGITGSTGSIVISRATDASTKRNFRMAYDNQYNFCFGDYESANNNTNVFKSQLSISYLAPADCLTINGSGNIGIGTTSPKSMLELYSTSQTVPEIILSGTDFSTNTTSTSGVAFLLGSNLTNDRQLWIADSSAIGVGTTNPVIRIMPNTRTIDAVATNGTTALSLGIGNTGSSLFLNGNNIYGDASQLNNFKFENNNQSNLIYPPPIGTSTSLTRYFSPSASNMQAGTYIMSASSNNTTAYLAFDKNLATEFTISSAYNVTTGNYSNSGANITSTFVSGTDIRGEWVQLYYDKGFAANSITITGITGSNAKCPKDFIVAGSKDSSNWILLSSQVGIGTYSPSNIISIYNFTSYNFYRLIVTKTISDPILSIADISFGGNPNTSFTPLDNYNILLYNTNEKQFPPFSYANNILINLETTTSNELFNVTPSSYFKETININNLSYNIYSSTSSGTVTFNKRYMFDYNTASNATNFARWATGQYNTSGAYTANTSTIGLNNQYKGDWIIVKFPFAIVLTKFIIWQTTTIANSPKSWKCYGSNDGVNWTEITDASRLEATYTSFSNTTQLPTYFDIPYLYLGWIFNSLLGTTSTQLQIVELQIFGKDDVTNSSLVNLYNNYNLYPPKLYDSSGGPSAINDFFIGPYYHYRYSVTINPYNNGYGIGTYQIAVDSYQGGNGAASLFDNNISNTVIWFNNYYVNGICTFNIFIVSGYIGCWVAIKFPNPIILKKFIFYSRSDIINNAPGEWKCYGSNDGINIIEITEANSSSTNRLTATDYGSGYFYEKNVDSSFNTSYLYYAWVFNKLVGTSATATQLMLSKLQIFGNTDKYLLTNNLSSLPKLRIYESIGTNSSPNNGSLVIEHGNPNSVSSIVFSSATNVSDYGYIKYIDDVTTAGFTGLNYFNISSVSREGIGALVLGCENNAGGQDSLIINPAGNVAIVPNSGRTYISGNVGIGTTNPGTNLLQVGSGGRLKIGVGSTDYSLIGTTDLDGTDNTRIVISGNTRGSFPGRIEYVSTAGDHIFYTTTATTERMRILNNGNVGIGIANPGSTLTVVGNANISGTLTLSSSNMLIQNFLFNSTGTTHTLLKNFNDVTSFGYRFINSPTSNGPGTPITTDQYYSWYIGLGSEYGASGVASYGAQFAIPRNIANPTMSIRFNEGNSWQAWSAITAGFLRGNAEFNSNAWQKSTEGSQRIYFENASTTIIKGHGATPLIFRNSTDTNLITVANTGNITATGDLTCSSLSCSSLAVTNRFASFTSSFTLAGGTTWVANFQFSAYSSLINGRTFLIDGEINPTTYSSGYSQIINNRGPGLGFVNKTFVSNGNVLPDWYNSYTTWYDGLNVYIYGSGITGTTCKVKITVLG
jgi:hypothetical protein